MTHRCKVLSDQYSHKQRSKAVNALKQAIVASHPGCEVSVANAFKILECRDDQASDYVMCYLSEDREYKLAKRLLNKLFVALPLDGVSFVVPCGSGFAVAMPTALAKFVAKAYCGHTYRNGYMQTFMPADFLNPVYLEFPLTLPVVPDTEYNKIVEADVSLLAVTKEEPLVAYDPDTELDEELYPVFEAQMSEVMRYRSPSGIEGKMGRKCVMSGSFLPRFFSMVGTRKDQHTPEQWLEFSNNVVCPRAKMLKKIGCVTSKGFVRTCFSLNVQLEAWQRRRFQGCDLTIIPGYENPTEGPCYQHSYDIRSSDFTIFPYLYRYVVKNFPREKLLWLPQVLDPTSGRYILVNKMLSGCVYTALVTNCFTSALCQHLQLGQYSLNGDSFTTPDVVYHPFLRLDEPFTLNGFSACCYVGTKYKIPKVVRPGHVYGALRYLCVYKAYECLRARCLSRMPKPTFEINGKTYADISLRELSEYLRQYGFRSRIVGKALNVSQCTNDESGSFSSSVSLLERPVYVRAYVE